MSVKNIVDNLMEGIKFYINERIKFAPYDRTDTAIVKGISEFGYVISYNNTLYSDVKTTGGTCSINETVKIVIPQNNINNIFILKGADITTLEENFINKNKITNSGVINVDGYVVDAKQLNPNISNTLAWNVNQLNSNLTTLSNNLNPTSIGNAVSSSGWEVVASNITINNSIGLLYGKITFIGTSTPTWGSTVGTFPNYHSGYNLPLLLFRTNGTLYLTASVDRYGVIKVYNPDLSKIVTGAEFHFQAIYAVA